MPRTHPLAAIALALIPLLVGCIGLDSGVGSDGASSATVQPAPPPSTARLELTVVDPAAHPVPGANVTVETGDASRVTRTQASGLAKLDRLDPGRAIVTVDAAGHVARQLSVDLPAGETVERSLVLRPDGENRTVVQRFEFQGFFECSATYLIITGDCTAPARAVAQEAGLELPADATNERNVLRFPVGNGWSSIHVVQTWEEPLAAAGSMMRVNLEPVDPNATGGHSPQYAEAEGQSPINLTVERGQLHPTASGEEMIVPEQGGWLRTRTYHLGLTQTHNPADTEFLGVGAAIQQEFTVTVEIVYR